MPTFNRFGILLRLGRPHEPSSRPPGRPSPGEVEAGGHGSARSKRKGPPRVEKRAEKHGEHSGIPVLRRHDSGYPTYIYICRYGMFCKNCTIQIPPYVRHEPCHTYPTYSRQTIRSRLCTSCKPLVYLRRKI